VVSPERFEQLVQDSFDRFNRFYVEHQAYFDDLFVKWKSDAVPATVIAVLPLAPSPSPAPVTPVVVAPELPPASELPLAPAAPVVVAPEPSLTPELTPASEQPLAPAAPVIVTPEPSPTPEQPLAPAAPPWTEPRFGGDFSRVRVHPSLPAAESPADAERAPES
jgi:hypothetical protein